MAARTAFTRVRQSPAAALPAPDKNLIAQLFAPGFARITLLLWLINFLSLLTIYSVNSWLPSLLHSLGIATASAVLAATMFQFGGMTGGLASAPLANRYGTEKSPPHISHSVDAAWSCWAWHHRSPRFSRRIMFGAGLGISAGQVGINACGCRSIPWIPRHRRGWALGMGRLGNIAGPPIWRTLLALGWRPSPMLLAISVPAFALTSALLVLAIGAPARSQLEDAFGVGLVELFLVGVADGKLSDRFHFVGRELEG